MRRGLVVGKFCPLHRGHMLLIDAALAACDDVTVISYTKPAFDGCGRAVREAWLRALYPGVRVLFVDDATEGMDAWGSVPHNDDPAETHRAFCGWLCRALLGIAVDAVFTSEDYGDGFARALTAYFSATVTHVSVDQARRAVPISGTAIRRDPHAHRAYLHPRVYADFVGRVCILGGESSGKTTLAQALATHLGTAWVPEYGRTLWEERGGALVHGDMRAIAAQQLAQEAMRAQDAQRWLVCDTSPLVTRFYSDALFGQVDPALEAMSHQPYAATFVCAPEFAFVQDGTRVDAAFRRRQHDWYCAELQRRGIAFTLLHGAVEARVAQAASVLAARS
jgi:HTH-type transcriptional repressor of NAD biosynthesis genes